MLRAIALTFLVLCLVGPAVAAADAPLRVLIWDEQQPQQKESYGDKFLGETIAAHLATLPGLTVTSMGLASPEQGLDEATLDRTDVVIWWAHMRSREVDDARAERVVSRVRAGRLGLIALHSAHWAKPFVRLMQERAKADALAQIPEAERAAAKWTYVNDAPYYQAIDARTPMTPALERIGDGWRLALPRCVFPLWRADGAPSHVSTLAPTHPIALGLPITWDIPRTEMYGGDFHVPKPDTVIFSERWDKGESFALSGSVWQVGKGRVFYFRPGHETFPVYQQAEPLRVVENAVRWLGAGSP